MLYTEIKNQIKEAMKIKDTVRKDVLKLVVDKAKTIIKETNPHDDGSCIPDDVIIQAVNKEMKQLNQTKDMLKGKEDTELYETTVQKIYILESYLPKMMTREEIKVAVTNILHNGEHYHNFGMVMKAVMSELKGKADSKLITEVVKEVLEPFRDKSVK